MYTQGYNDAICELGLDKTASVGADAKALWNSTKNKATYTGKKTWDGAKGMYQTAKDTAIDQMENHTGRTLGLTAGAGALAGSGFTYGARRGYNTAQSEIKADKLKAVRKARREAKEKTATDSSLLRKAWEATKRTGQSGLDYAAAHPGIAYGAAAGAGALGGAGMMYGTGWGGAKPGMSNEERVLAEIEAKAEERAAAERAALVAGQ